MSDTYEALLKRHCSGEKYVSAKTVAEHLSLDTYTIYKMAQRGLIPSFKIGKSRRFKISDVEMALTSNCKVLV